MYVFGFYIQCIYFIFLPLALFFNFFVSAPLNRVTWSLGAIEMLLLLLLLFL